MNKYIIILSLFFCSCTKYRVYNLETKTISIINDDSGYKNGDTILHSFKKSLSPSGDGVLYKREKCLILNKIIGWN